MSPNKYILNLVGDDKVKLTNTYEVLQLHDLPHIVQTHIKHKCAACLYNVCCAMNQLWNFQYVPKKMRQPQKWLDTAHVTQVYYTYEVHAVFPPFEYFKDMELIRLVQLYVEIE